MMGTGLTFTQLSNTIGTLMLLFFTGVVIFRFVLAFRNYIYTGELGDSDYCFIYQLFEEKSINKYMFIGHHPGFVLIDAFCFFVITIAAALGFWVAYVVVGLIMLLAKVMRKRIAIKQKFVGNLKGDQLDE